MKDILAKLLADGESKLSAPEEEGEVCPTCKGSGKVDSTPEE